MKALGHGSLYLTSRLFEAFDRDGNGKVDIKEIINGLRFLNYPHGRERIKMAFKMLDLNDNGKISKSEFKSIAQSMERQQEMMKNVHEDTEGITQSFLADFATFGATNFAQLDANNDGSHLHLLRLTLNSSTSS